MSTTQQHYVLNLMFCTKLDFVVGITKTKGPELLLKKLTFPGGKLDGDETPQEAAAREMLEETGVKTDPENWHVFDAVHTEDYVLHKMVTVSEKAFYTRRCKEEPVWHLAVKRHLEYATSGPNQYAQDFVKTLQDALTFVQASTQSTIEQSQAIADVTA